MISKLISSNQFREQVLRSFILHRDFKACLSLKQAEQILVEREQEVNKYGKTALLQFLNNYPLNYSYKSINSPLKICLYPLRFQDLNTYEEQLRFSVLSKLIEYVQISDKKIISDELEKIQQRFQQIIKIRPFDAVHAINFLHLQKENRNSKLFFHCLEAIRKTDYAILRTVFPKTLPILIRRLSCNEWNILRNFPSLLEFITFEYIPKDLIAIRQILIIEKIGEMQLHLCMHMKIPPCIDYVIGHYYSLVTSGKRVDVHQLTSILKTFDYLPIHYNEAAFDAIFSKILQLTENQDIFLQNMPFRRLAEDQKEKIIKLYLKKKSSISQLIYCGNNPIIRSELIRIGHHKKMLEQLEIITVNNQREYFAIIICSAILCEFYKDAPVVLAKISTKIIHETNKFFRNNRLHEISRFFSTSNVLNMILLKEKLKINQFNDLVNRIKEQTIQRSAREKDFKDLVFIDSITEAVSLYHNTDIAEIREIMSNLIINFVKKSDKFFFQKYSDMIYVLIKSDYYQEYKPTINSILALMKPEDAPFFVEIFNKYPHKNMKLVGQIFNLMWGIDPSFSTIGRFMITSSYTNFTSARGELLRNYRQALENLQPLLNIASIEKYTLSELTYILKFCRNFYFYISEFSRKMLLLSIKQATETDFSIDKGKGLLSFITEAVALKDVSSAGKELNAKLMVLVNKLCSSFPEITLYKIKNIEFMWLLGELVSQDRVQLLLSEIVGGLTYSPKQVHLLFLLLKLDSFGAIKLRSHLELKFFNIIKDSIQSKDSSISQILKEVSIPFREGEKTLQSNKSSFIPQILVRCVQTQKSKQNFDYFMRLASYGNFIRSQQLVEISLRKLSSASLYPSHIKKIISLLKFYRNIDIGQLSERLLAETLKNYYHLEAEVPEILYSIHFLKHSTNQNQDDYTVQLLKKLQSKTLEVIKTSQKLISKINEKSSSQQLFSILVYIWVSLKINIFQPNIAQQLKFMISHYQYFTTEKQHFHGISSDSLAYMMLASVAYLQKNAPEQLGEPRKRGLFKKSADFSSAATKMAEEKLRTISKGCPAEVRDRLKAKLIDEGLVERPVVKSEDYSFELQKIYKNIPINALIKKNSRQYVGLYVNQLYLNRKGGKKGRLAFTKNCLELITDLEVLLITQKQKIKFQ